ncbi:MAG: hypothetical protein KJ709_04720 [Nanoarchaeota archaeon]|nr:hypothetical protein [Nanoarchaeota archaeon]
MAKKELSAEEAEIIEGINKKLSGKGYVSFAEESCERISFLRFLYTKCVAFFRTTTLRSGVGPSGEFML